MVFLASTFTVVLISIGVFLFVILLLVVMLLYARYKLTPQGDVKLQINDKEFTVSPGSTVLTTMSNQGIFLPSACGGGGTCGMCKCQITEGGGTILPTETGFFTRKEQQRLREVLITSPGIRIIGASAKMMEYTYDYSNPFYELFRMINLEGLTKEETVTLLLKLGEHYKQESIKKIVKEEPGRIEALRRLTGGVPRTIVLLFEIELQLTELRSRG